MTMLLRTRRSLPRLPVSTPHYFGESLRAPNRAGLLLPDNRSLHYEAQSGFRQYRAPGRRYSLVLRVEATEAKKEFPARIRRLNEPPMKSKGEEGCQCL